MICKKCNENEKLLRTLKKWGGVEYVAENVEGEFADMIREAMEYGRQYGVDGLRLPFWN